MDLEQKISPVASLSSVAMESQVSDVIHSAPTLSTSSSACFVQDNYHDAKWFGFEHADQDDQGLLDFVYADLLNLNGFAS